ncbi:hypothetical protein [Luteolibacter soli]|uniref:Uncharacterized protein n=1 Tax=Luteolibacter soli TaxID=3135280 RepID=A0ABU9AYQ2_9BACT
MPHPDLLNLCYELQGGPAEPMTMPVTERIAAVWRGPGTWEVRFLATMRAAEAERVGLWEDITGAVVQMHAIEEFLRKKYSAEVMRRYSTISTMTIARKRLRSDCRLLEEAIGISEQTHTPLPPWWWKFRPSVRK